MLKSASGRLMLEYARVMADNRAEMDFEYDERLHGDLHHPYAGQGTT